MKKNLEKPSCSCNSIKHEVKSETRTGISLKKMLGGLNGLLLIYLISIIIPSQDVFSQVTYDNNQKWKWLHPKPQGGYLLWCKMWDKNTWYFAGQNGLFMKTTNGGSNWSISYNASRIISVISLQKGDIRSAHFFNQNTGILVGSFGSVFKTTNAGTTFDSIPGIFINTYTWYKVFFLNQNTGYIAGANDNLVKTTNGGSNWNFITSIPTAPNFDIWTPNDTLIIISSSGGNIKRSTNGGVNWATINTGSSSELYRLCFVNTDTGFVSGTSGAVRMTTNGGFSWISVNGGLPVSKYYDLDYRTTGPNREIYLTGNGQYIYKTTNYGSSWDTVGIWGANQSFLIQYQAYYCTDLGNSDTLLTVGDGLINKRNSAGERICYLDFLKYGYNNISDIWVSGNKIWAVGTYTVTTPHQNDQIIYSSDKGNTWVKQNITGGSTGKFTRISMINDNTGFTAGTEGKIRKTINGGNTWDSLISPTTTLLRKIEFVNSNTGWVFGDAGTIYKSTDGGLSWSQQTAAGVNSIIFGADMIDENTGWIVGRDAKVSKTTNGGSSWTAQNPNTYLMFDLFSIKMLDANTGYLGGVRTFRKTTDGGTTWDSVPQPFPTNGTFFQITGMDFINPQVGMINIFFMTLKTTNGGTSWIIDNIGVEAGNISDQNYSNIKMISPDSAYITTIFSGVLQYAGSPLGIIEWENSVPEDYMLYQNYPNPFNPATTIKFAIPTPGNVSLKVYDITGREVRTIINNLGLNRGTVTHNFDGTDLASGVYFYSLYIDGNMIDTKKMLLIK